MQTYNITFVIKIAEKSSPTDAFNTI